VLLSLLLNIFSYQVKDTRVKCIINGANFMGPGKALDKRLNPDWTPKPDYMPINRVDEAACNHNLLYNQLIDTQHRYHANQLMVDEIDSIGDLTPKERIMRAVAKPILLGKSKLD